MEIQIGKRKTEIDLISKEGNKVQIQIDGKPHEVDIVMAENGSCSILYNGKSYHAELTSSEDKKKYEVDLFHRSYPIEIIDTQTKYLRLKREETEKQENCIVAPMPGKVVKILVQKGDVLSTGDIVIVLEAMKMQSNYKVYSPCKVEEILVKEGDKVNSNQIMIKLDLIKHK